MPWEQTEKLVQELAWRDYWQQVWLAKGDGINHDIKNKQQPVTGHGIPVAIKNATTGIEAIDKAITTLYKTGYMHNHMRMYIAAICCNVAKVHWLQPAQWMYSHLLDGDQASNQLSWQWVAGAFSNKKYVANQDNINKYFFSKQKGTFLDIPYESFADIRIPSVLEDNLPLAVASKLPNKTKPILDADKETLIYNYYNLDPFWKEEEDVQRILLLEPSFFETNPVSDKCINFVLKLAENIKNIQVFVGEFSDILLQVDEHKISYKEHPTNQHYKGKEVSRDWITDVTGYYPSFFKFWKKCKREIKW